MSGSNRRQPSPPRTEPLALTFTGRGHPAIRASHEKTLELTNESQITARATCVVAVTTDIDAVAVAQVRGDVEFELAVAQPEPAGASRPELVARGHGTINPDHAVSGRIIIRRSDNGDADTLIVSASLTAADVPDELRAALAAPESLVYLRIREQQPPEPLVIVGAPTTPRLVRLAQRADGERTYVAETAVADTGLMSFADTAITIAGQSLSQLPSYRVAADTWLNETLLSARLQPAPLTVLGSMTDSRDVAKSVASARQSAAPVIFRAPLSVGQQLVGDSQLAADTVIALSTATRDVGTQLRWTTVEQLLATPTTQQWHSCVVLPTTDRPLVDAVAVIRALHEQGVSARSIAEAMAGWGIKRRQVYEICQS